MTPYERAQQLQQLGISELAGKRNHPVIQTALWLCGFDPEEPDETPWCSAMVNLCHRLEGWPHTNSAAARSWLRLGIEVPIEKALAGDVVILKRGTGPQPGPEVLAAPGHVGFVHHLSIDPGDVTGVKRLVHVLGGNQGNRITIAPFPFEQVLGVRRILH